MQGIIVGNIANLYNVKAEDGIIYKASARGKFKQGDIVPVVGDYVNIEVIDTNKNEAVIDKIFDRTSYIKRPKIANISQIILMVSTKDPKPDLLMLDKQLAYAELLNVKPIIVVNKIDLDDSYKQIEKIYKNIGYDVISISAKSDSVDSLLEMIKNKISVFAGNSGVGKSTTINSLFNKEITLEGEISKKNKRGKNTTTDVKLYELDSNTFIADTPGFSTFEITEIESKDLDNYFKEFKKYKDKCEFVGCTHIKEQNCGIKEAVEKGEISRERYERFCIIYQEIKDKEARKW